MVVTIDQKVRKLRVWLDELPPARYAPDDAIDFSLPSVVQRVPAMRQVAVEYYHYTEHILDGLLGATFEPWSTDALCFHVARSLTAGQSIDWSLNPFYGGHVGLISATTVEYIAAGLRDSPVAANLGAGRLTFDCAVEGAPIVMRWLADAVIMLLVEGQPEMDEEGLAALMAQVGPPYLWFVRGVSPSTDAEVPS